MATKNIEEIIKFLDSPAGQAALEEFWEKKEIERQRMDRYADKLKSLSEDELRSFVEKVRTKYASVEYTDRWYKQGREPQEELYWVLLHYAKKYCKEAGPENYVFFVTECYYLFNDTIIQRLDGQGSVVQILSIEEKERQNKIDKSYQR